MAKCERSEVKSTTDACLCAARYKFGTFEVLFM
jgi:hypothetical protein